MILPFANSKDGILFFPAYLSDYFLDIYRAFLVLNFSGVFCSWINNLACVDNYAWPLYHNNWAFIIVAVAFMCNSSGCIVGLNVWKWGHSKPWQPDLDWGTEKSGVSVPSFAHSAVTGALTWNADVLSSPQPWSPHPQHSTATIPSQVR